MVETVNPDPRSSIQPFSALIPSVNAKWPSVLHPYLTCKITNTVFLTQTLTSGWAPLNKVLCFKEKRVIVRYKTLRM